MGIVKEGRVLVVDGHRSFRESLKKDFRVVHPVNLANVEQSRRGLPRLVTHVAGACGINDLRVTS